MRFLVWIPVISNHTFFCYVTPIKCKKLFHVREETSNVEIFSYHSKVSEWIDSLNKWNHPCTINAGLVPSGWPRLFSYSPKVHSLHSSHSPSLPAASHVRRLLTTFQIKYKIPQVRPYMVSPRFAHLLHYAWCPSHKGLLSVPPSSFHLYWHFSLLEYPASSHPLAGSFSFRYQLNDTSSKRPFLTPCWS